MNTGFQRSAATPRGAWTTTSPAGKVIPGKSQNRKNLTTIAAARGIPYVAQASPHNFRDLIAKAETAFDTEGPAFINVLSPCPRGWRSKDQDSIALAKLMVDSCFWPLYEIVDGVYNLSYNPKKRKGNIRDWMKQQGRFKHLFKPENEHLIAELQENVDQEWENLKKLAGVEKTQPDPAHKRGPQVESRQVERSRTELSESRFCYFLELGADNYHTKAAGDGRTVQYHSHEVRWHFGC